jgi:hypothetical protein
MSFRAWRQQAKLLKVVEWLAAGRSVGDIAFCLATQAPAPSLRCSGRLLALLPDSISRMK